MQRKLPDVNARYRIVDEIAQGGMGTVFLGLQSDTSGGRVTPVAIKQLHTHLIEDESAMGSFADEARIASILHHPNLVRVHDIAPIEGQLVIVMDWVDGVALNVLGRKREAPLPIPVIRRIIVDALAGLHAAHELKDENGNALGVVHRDISPQNVLVGADGLARITDFGIAMAKGRLAPATVAGGVKGKVPYLSPEQVNRKPIDRRSDIFAAGAVAWELLTGRRLFQAGSEGEVLAMILREPLVPPSSVRLDVPLDLDEAVLKALERKLERRFQTAAELAKAIEAGGPVASYDEVGRAVLAHSGPAIAARRKKLAAARERSFQPRTLEEEMTATIVVPVAPTSRRASFVPGNSDRVVIAPSSSITPLGSIPPPPPSIPPPSISPSLPPTATTGRTMTKLPGAVDDVDARGRDRRARGRDHPRREVFGRRRQAEDDVPHRTVDPRAPDRNGGADPSDERDRFRSDPHTDANAHARGAAADQAAPAARRRGWTTDHAQTQAAGSRSMPDDL